MRRECPNASPECKYYGRKPPQELRGLQEHGLFNYSLARLLAFTKPTVVSSARHTARVFVPICKILGFTKRCDKNRCSAVLYLRTLSSPPTVVGGVVAIVVNTVNRVFGRWSFTHVGYKVLESVLAKPTVTNLDASAAITFILSVLAVIASGFHCVVYPIFVLMRGTHPVIVLRIVRARKTFRPYAATAAFARVIIPPAAVALKRIATVALNSKATATVEGMLLSGRYDSEAAFAIHNPIIPQRSAI